MGLQVNSNYTPPRAVKLSHYENKVNEKTHKVELVKVDDCREFCDIEDYDLDVLLHSGENLKSVSTVLYGGAPSVDNVKQVEEEKTEEKQEKTEDKKENE